MLHEDGWYPVATRGSHRQFKHSTKTGRVTVPGKPSDDLAPAPLTALRPYIEKEAVLPAIDVLLKEIRDEVSENHC